MSDIIKELGITSGPWKVQDSYDESNHGFASGKDNYVPHSSCWNEAGYNGCRATDESKANDKLIASAPELLEIVLKLRESIITVNAERGYISDMDGEDLDIFEIESAIEKATGKTWEDLIKK